MDPNSLGSNIGNVASGLAADSRSLEQLKRAARDDPRQAVKKVAAQFEALFMQMVLKSMREATPHSGLLDSQEQDMYRGMLDQQMAQQISGHGTGLSEMIAHQLGRNLPGAAPSAALPGQPGAAATAPALSAPGAAPTEAVGTSTAPAAAQRDFMQQHRADAVRGKQRTGVPANFILGQAALESGWGRREIRGPDGAPSYNLFGIKAGSGWQGK